MTFPKHVLLDIYKKLYTIRVFETRCIQLYRAAEIRGYFHPYLGQEAIAVGVCAALRPQDYIFSTHRGHGHCIARGAAIDKMTAELFGKETGYCKGRGGSMHIADLSVGNMGANGIVGAGIPLGAGAALGAKIRQEDRVAVVFTSDGGANNGVFGESLNLAAIWNAPLILVVENNQYAVSTPIEDSTRDPNLYKKGAAYGVPAEPVDGNNTLEVYERAKNAVITCREGKGPVLIEAKTYRHGGHHCNDPGKYMPADRMQYYKSKDPVLLGRKALMEQAQMEENEIQAVEQQIDQDMEQAIAYAKSCPEPSISSFVAEVEAY
ncbi:hypothetical protein GF373_12770 [bacterium]|nr:hypothetical protein [bacterium]